MKKTRALDTASGAVNLMAQAASGVPDIPAHIKLRPQDEPFFAAIMSSRAKNEWSDLDIAVAAQLAWTQAQIAHEAESFESEGAVITNERGTPVTNPRFRALGDLKSSQLSLMRALALHTMKDPKEATKQRRALGDARGVLEDLKDSLIATP